MDSLKSILILLFASMSINCFGQDCLLTDEIEAQKPLEEGKCYVYMLLPDFYKTVTEQVLMPPLSEEARMRDLIMRTTRVFIKKGYCDWVEIICEEDETSELHYQIKDALRKRGYDGGYPLNHFLSKLQKDFGLPSGNFNIETMEALGIDYKRFIFGNDE
ncbi:MAG: hypothetical protein ACPGVB_07215 [Chitinophagales bacterium]